ncbi:glucose-1-phosphate cytidylyltransferase [Flavobacteriaceae bacterium]|nr:glucose-1-phosphate cytidylyltransferase [Flavobacteriaceae bacterium]
MKVVILAGGFGTRLAEYTSLIPKPMVPIGNKPMLVHIMEIYASHGFNEFVIALGYKSEIIKEYFLNYHALNSDFEVDLKNGSVKFINEVDKDWKVQLIDTGLNSMTGGRIKRLSSIIGDNTFMLTYGDAVSSVNIKELVNFHKKSGKLATVTAVHPIARFGELAMDEGNNVKSFSEKTQINSGWINGGFFVFEPKVFDLIENDSTVLEKKPLEWLANNSQLNAYKHDGFWQCMDTVRERDNLEEIWKSGNAPWKK